MSHPLSRLDRRLAILGEQIASQQRETISVERFNRDDHQPDGTVRPPRLEINRIAEGAGTVVKIPPEVAKAAEDAKPAPWRPSVPPSGIAAAMHLIKEALLADEGYAIGWHANLAVAIKDAHEWSWARDVSAPDIAADLILQRLFGLPSNPDRCQMLGTQPRDHGPAMADVNAQMELERIEPYSVLQQRRQQEIQELLNQEVESFRRMFPHIPV